MDKNLLEYEMKKAGISIAEMCETLEISRSAFYRKCNGISDFTQTEIAKIMEVLKVNNPVPIFFAN